MKRVTAFVGSARKKYTYDAVTQFLGNLQSMDDFACEVVTLSDYHLDLRLHVCLEGWGALPLRR